MSTVKVAIALALIGLGYLVWQRHVERVEIAAIAAITDPYGFIGMDPPTGASAKEVIVVAAINCPKAAGRQADALAEKLAELKIPHTRTSNISFSFENPDPAILRLHNRIMRADPPLVFINGKMKSNPSLDDVLTEFQAAQL